MKLKVKVIPGASRSEVAGRLGDAVKLRVAAPPEAGKANKAVLALLAQATGIPPAQLHILSGKSSCHKLIEIPDHAAEKLQDLCRG